MERRTEERVPVKIPMEVTTSSMLRPMRIVADNFCPSGAHLCAALPLELGERIICQFEVPGMEGSFVYDSRVVHVNENQETRLLTNGGIGIEFVNTSAFEQTAIRRALWDLVEYYEQPAQKSL